MEQITGSSCVSSHLGSKTGFLEGPNMATYSFTYLSISQNEPSVIANNHQPRPWLFGTTSRNFWNQFGSVKVKNSRLICHFVTDSHY